MRSRLGHRALALFAAAAIGFTMVASAMASSPSPPAVNASIDVIHTASPISLPAGGGLIAYTYVVTNTGTMPLSNVIVADDACGPVSSTGGDRNGNGVLDVTETWTYACSVSVSKTIIGTALATGFVAGVPVSATSTTLVTVARPVPTPGPSLNPTEPPSPAPTAAVDSSSGPPAGASETPGGSVAGVTSPPGAGGQAGASDAPAGLGGSPPGSTPSGLVLMIIALTGLAASVIILALGRGSSR
jgi:hypothetical protein